MFLTLDIGLWTYEDMNISFELHDSVAIICLDRPEKLNALTRDALIELGETFGHIEHEREVRAVILTGAGERAFSAGTIMM